MQKLESAIQSVMSEPGVIASLNELDRLPQQFLAAPLQLLATLVDGDRLLQRHLAVLEPLDDRLKLLDRPDRASRAVVRVLERQDRCVWLVEAVGRPHGCAQLFGRDAAAVAGSCR